MATDTTQAVRQAIANYAESVNRADTALAAEIWLTDQRASFIHPRGHETRLERNP